MSTSEERQSADGPRDARECAGVVDRLPLFVGGDLDAPASADVERHLATCAACRGAHENMARAFRRFFECEHRAAATELAGNGLVEGVLAALAGERAGARRRDAVAAPAGPRGEAAVVDGELDDAGRFAADFAADYEPPGISGKRTVRWLAGSVLAACVVLGVATVLQLAPRQGAVPNDATPGLDVRGPGLVADADRSIGGSGAPEVGPQGVGSNGGLRRLGVDQAGDRLIFQPFEAAPQAPAGGESLVGYPTWR